MENLTKEDYHMWLCGIEGIGSKKLWNLVEHIPEAAQIFHAPESCLEKVIGITKKDVHNIVESRKKYNPDFWKNQLAALEMKCITFFSEEYPAAMRKIYQPPKRLFYRGSFPTEEYRIAIVGARDCTLYGRQMAKHFSSVLAAEGMGIISGMARGIGGWAHQGALEGGGKTYAVLGNSAEICYPREHERLYQSIIRRGGVISEYPPHTEAHPGYFPMRNRIISGLSQAVLVVEAREKSGSLITADQALEQGKDVFVVPGRVGDTLSEGCNNLIKQGASLVTKPEEILESFGVKSKKKEKDFIKNNIYLETKEKMVYASLSLEPKNVNTLAGELRMQQTEVMRCLLSLQKIGIIQEIGNHYYIKCC